MSHPCTRYSQHRPLREGLIYRCACGEWWVGDPERQLEFPFFKEESFRRCRVCNRPLKAPLSVKLGIGPLCRKKVRGSRCRPPAGAIQ